MAESVCRGGATVVLRLPSRWRPCNRYSHCDSPQDWIRKRVIRGQEWAKRYAFRSQICAFSDSVFPSNYHRPMHPTAEIVSNRLNEARLSRLSRLILIVAVAWACFSLEYFLSGYPWVSGICALFAFLSSVLCPLVSHYPTYRRLVAHLFLAVCLTGLCCVSLVTGQSSSYATLFLCCFGLFAAHMLGGLSLIHI